MSDPLIQNISSTLGIFAYQNEALESFEKRALYSAARFQVESFCLDDGKSGKAGVTKRGITYRFNKWLSTLAHIYPWCEGWFKFEDKGAAPIYDRLLGVGDIFPSSSGELIRASAPHVQPVTKDISLLLGFFDPSEGADNLQHQHVASGLASILQQEGSPSALPSMNFRWWENLLPYLDWQEASQLGDLQYANPKRNRWSIAKADVWTDSPLRNTDVTLAKTDVGYAPEYYAISWRGSRTFAARIEWHDAESLFFHLKASCGNPAVARFKSIDRLHFRLNAPIYYIAYEGGRWLDAMTWPVMDIDDGFDRIARIEAKDAIASVLNACDIAVKEV